MSIIRFINDRNRTPQSLRQVLGYCSRKNTVPYEFVGGHGVLKENIDSQMIGMKKLFHQENGKQYLHLIVSNDSTVNDAAVAHKIGNLIAQFFSEFQVAVYTHTDTKNLHSHLVVNTVNCITGKKLSMRRSDFHEFLTYANQIFSRNGLNPISQKQLLICDQESTDDAWDEDCDDWDWYEDDEEETDKEMSYLKDLCKVKENNTGIRKGLHFSDTESEMCDMISYLQSL